MNNWLERTELLIGEENIKKLKNAHILVAGLGGVGGFAAEMLCRAGVGTLSIIDSDNFVESNRNRQIGALISTIGKSKTEVMKSRLLDINPNIQIYSYCEYLKENEIKEILLKEKYDYIIDAIDTLTPKFFVIYHSVINKLKFISSMGAGGKLNPAEIKITDISKSYECKLAYKIRKKLHAHNITTGFKVVFSSETVPRSVIISEETGPNKKSTIGTISYIPAIFGCYCASEAIKEILA
jgi:tRNA A37 threonylcarbamoyladenosine dehydratase